MSISTTEGLLFVYEFAAGRLGLGLMIFSTLKLMPMNDARFDGVSAKHAETLSREHALVGGFVAAA